MRNRGFTLIEVLVAIALFSVLGWVLIRIFASAQATTTTVNAAATLDSELATAERSLRGLVEGHAFAGFLYGDGQSMALIYRIGGVHPKQSETFSTDSTIYFDATPPSSPVKAGLIDAPGDTLYMVAVANEGADKIDLACTPGVSWSPTTVYSAAGTIEIGLGSALNARYTTSSFEPTTLYYRTNQASWTPLLSDVQAFSISYLYRDPAGLEARAYPEDGRAPWNPISGDTDKTLYPKLAVDDPDRLYVTGAVLKVTLSRGDVERRAEILLPFNREERRYVRVNACADSRSAVGALTLEIRGLPPGRETPVRIDGPDPDVVGDYRVGQVWPRALAGDYTITARAVSYVDGNGVTHVFAPRVDPDIPLRLADPARWSVQVSSWRPARARVVYEEQPAVLTLVKRVIFVAIPLGWVVPGNGDGGFTGPSGQPSFWYSGALGFSASPDVLADACDDGYPCTSDGIGWYTGDPYPVWGGQHSAYVRPGLYRATPNSLLSVSWLLKISIYPTFPIPTVIFGGCFNGNFLASAEQPLGSGESKSLFVDYPCVPLIP